jgi:hypothetical protein
MIRETIVTTRSADGSAHIAPMGIHERKDRLVVAPFKPSTTLENLRREGYAVINYTDDVRVFAGCLTGRRDWPVTAAKHVPGIRLQDCLAHVELTIEAVEDDDVRPRFIGRAVHEQLHAPFRGFNRAQAAVIEAAILVSRLDRLSREKIESELKYLNIAVEKTAGPREEQAWRWLMEAVERQLRPDRAQQR